MRLRAGHQAFVVSASNPWFRLGIAESCKTLSSPTIRLNLSGRLPNYLIDICEKPREHNLIDQDV